MTFCVMTPEVSSVESCATRRAKSMADMPPSASVEIDVTSVTLVITRLRVLILDWTISYLCL